MGAEWESRECGKEKRVRMKHREGLGDEVQRDSEETRMKGSPTDICLKLHIRVAGIREEGRRRLQRVPEVAPNLLRLEESKKQSICKKLGRPGKAPTTSGLDL